jgi:hypothetical protein
MGGDKAEDDKMKGGKKSIALLALNKKIQVCKTHLGWFKHN